MPRDEEETLPLIEAGADVLVLGCTHYPFLRPLIQDVVGPDVKIIDTGAAVARHALQLLKNRCQPASPQTSCQVITTGDLDTLNKLFPRLCPGIRAEFTSSDQIKS